MILVALAASIFSGLAVQATARTPAVGAGLCEAQIISAARRYGVPEGILSASSALPTQIFIWENAAEAAFHERTAAAIIVLLVFMVVMNAVAIVLRRRLERRW